MRRADPDGNYRFLLARLYTAEERYPQAAALYAELVDLYPEDAAIIAQSAQALYLAGGRQPAPAVQALVDRAFAIDPAQVTLLGLVGMDRFQAGDYRGALDYWQKLLDQLPPGAPDAGVIRDGIAMARSRLGESAGPTPGAPVPDSGAPRAAAGPRLQVAVSLAPGLELRPRGYRVRVRARRRRPADAVGRGAFSGHGTAARRGAERCDGHCAGDEAVELSPVSVIARISRQGGVSAQPGDLEGGGEPLTLTGGEQSIQVLIDRTI